VVALTCVLAFTGCGSSQNALRPDSDATGQITGLWWWMLGAAWVVFLGVVAFLVLGWRRRHKEGLPIFGQSEMASTGVVVVLGVAVPTVVLVALFVAANLFVIQTTEAPAKTSTTMTVHVIGHQWWWEFRYPGTGVVTANELHIPARTRVNMVATTGDVIHSFWVPELNRKIDTIPGKRNRILFYADRTGVYRGQCAEFCGVQHAHMSMKVFVQTPAAFRAWLADQRRPARPPRSALQRAGQQVFLHQQCSSCHTIRGTPAQGKIGPDLSHLATRSSLAANTIPNDPAHLREWVSEPQHVKPGNDMPDLNLTSSQFRAVVAYLDGLH
jgi:cytochrome c oxidase subunit 2